MIPTFSNISTTQEFVAHQSTIERSLDNWVSDCDVKERSNRVIAKTRILSALHTNSPALSLFRLNLTTLPPEIGQLMQLRELDLGLNRIASLPDSLGDLTQLTTLFLNHNQLRTLPDSLGNLSLLQSLCLDNNPLSSLPMTLGNIPSLTDIDHENNQALPRAQVRAILFLCKARKKEGANVSAQTLIDAQKMYNGENL